MVIYPYTLSNLSGAGAVPADGKPVRAVHFNRLFREISGIESALGNGRQLRGDSTVGPRLADRLSELNADGSLKRELITDDDYSENKRGAYRYFDSQVESVTFTTSSMRTTVKLAYSVWDEPPAFFFTYGNTAGTWEPNLARRLMLGISEVGCRLEGRKFQGNPVDATTNLHVHWFAVSRSLKVFEDNVAWAIRPVRTGS